MTLPPIAVVTPTMNSAAHLERALRSVADQAYPSIEHWVIDGGSTDGTLDILRRWQPRLAGWISEPDAGIADAFNKGIARCTSPLILILNSDDELLPGALHVAGEAHARQPNAILHGDMLWHDGQVERRVRPRLWGGRDGIGRSIWFDMPIHHPGCFVPREVYTRIGRYDTSFQLSMDVDFVLRAYRARVPLHYLGRPMVRFHVGGASTQRTRQALRECYRAQRKNHVFLPAVMLAYAAKWSVNRIKAVTGWRLRPGQADAR